MSRVAFVGSSAVEPGSLLPGAIARELGLLRPDWETFGVRGSRIAQWTDPELPPGLRALVVLLTANDPRPQASDIRAVDAALRRFAPLVVWLPPMPYVVTSRVAGRNLLMRAALAASGVSWVDVPVVLEPRHWAPDEVHLTRAGYGEYARQVSPMLWGRLAGRPSPRARPSTPAAAGTSIGQVLTSGGLRLTVTSEDALWLARACAGEGGGEADARAVTSTMVRRWTMLRDASSRSPFHTLSDLVVGRFVGDWPYEGEGRAVELRGYSQPVSVQYRGPGSRAARRLRYRTMGWVDISLWRRTAVLRVLTGRAALTARSSVHFAARALVERRLPEHPDWGVVSVPGASNVYVSTGHSRSYRDPVVFGADGRRAPRLSSPSVRPPRPTSALRSRSGAGSALLAGAVASVVVALARRG